MATLLQIRTQIVREADALGNLSLADATDKAYIDSYANSALARLHDVLTNAFNDYQVTGASTAQITSVATAQFALPTCLKVRDVEYLGPAGTTAAVSLNMFNWTERNRIFVERQYCIAGQLVLIRPTASALGFYKVWLTPVFGTLVADGDIYDAINGWEELAVLDAAMRIKDDMEKDSSRLQARFDALLQHVHESASKRVSARPSRVRRVKTSLYERLMMADLDPGRFT